MAPKMCNVSFVLLLISLTMTSSKRASRRNWAKTMESMAGDEGGVCELEVTCKNSQGIPISLPIKGPTGPSGKPGIPGLPGKPGPAGDPGQLRGEDQPRVAFFAGLNANFGPVKRNTDLVFDKIITNVGDTFGPSTGRFTAPFNGTYTFTITVAAQGRQRAAVEVVLNKKMVATVWAESIPFWASATTTLVLTLETGDQVWAVVLSRASHLHGYMYSSFSGHCLFRGF